MERRTFCSWLAVPRQRRRLREAAVPERRERQLIAQAGGEDDVARGRIRKVSMRFRSTAISAVSIIFVVQPSQAQLACEIPKSCLRLKSEATMGCATGGMSYRNTVSAVQIQGCPTSFKLRYRTPGGKTEEFEVFKQPDWFSTCGGQPSEIVLVPDACGEPPAKTPEKSAATLGGPLVGRTIIITWGTGSIFSQLGRPRTTLRVSEKSVRAAAIWAGREQDFPINGAKNPQTIWNFYSKVEPSKIQLFADVDHYWVVRGDPAIGAFDNSPNNAVTPYWGTLRELYEVTISGTSCVARYSSGGMHYERGREPERAETATSCSIH